MKKTPRRSLQRDRFVYVARLRRIAAGFAGVRDGEFGSLRIEIDGDRGTLVEHDGEGNHALAFWNAAGVVALQFIHDIPEAHADASPEHHLNGVPAELAELAAAALSTKPRLATSGAWALGDEAGGEWREMNMLDLHMRPPDELVEMLSFGGDEETEILLRAEEATRT